MRDILLQCSGLLAIAAAILHGVLGETKVFARATIEPAWSRGIIRAVWQASVVDWIGAGLLLIAAPWMGSDLARHLIIVICGAVFAFAAFGNARASRGKHFGWLVLSAVVVLAVAGY